MIAFLTYPLSRVPVGRVFTFAARPGERWIRVADHGGCIRIQHLQHRLVTTARADARVHSISLEG